MATRIGVIADIHADLASLKQALALLDEQRVVGVICTGDLVERGTEGDGVVRLLRERQVPSVLGNHDIDCHSNQPWLRENAPESHLLLTDETLDYLKTLPPTLRFTRDGVRVLVAHGTPDNPRTYLYVGSPPDLYEQIAEEAEADVILLGHTHRPMRVQIQGVWVFNPGSVSRESEVYGKGSHTCAVLTLPYRTFEVYEIESGQLVEDVPTVKHGTILKPGAD